MSIAYPEKALLDLVHIRHLTGRRLTWERLRSLLDHMYLEELDRERLAAFAERFGGRVQEIVQKIMTPG